MNGDFDDRYGGCTLASQCGGPATPTFPKPPCTKTGYPSNYREEGYAPAAVTRTMGDS